MVTGVCFEVEDILGTHVEFQRRNSHSRSDVGDSLASRATSCTRFMCVLVNFVYWLPLVLSQLCNNCSCVLLVRLARRDVSPR